ncbi:MAG: hypothetical protein EOO41_04685, partial [Methanobacteriota archaeon]
MSAEDAAAVATNPSHKLDYYRMRLPDVMAAQAIAQHKATSGKGVDDLVVRATAADSSFMQQCLLRVLRACAARPHYASALWPARARLQTALRREHIRLGESLTAFQAERLYIKRVQQLPEYGASFFTCTLVRTTTDDPVAHGSRSAPPVPAWAEDITVSRVGAAGAPPPLPVLVGINATGVMLRPLPPMHSAGTSYAYSANAPGTRRGTYPTLLSAPTASEELTDDGAPVGWLVHPVHFVEVWGIKKSRPTFTYRVRERYLRIIELTSTSYKEVRCGGVRVPCAARCATTRASRHCTAAAAAAYPRRTSLTADGIHPPHVRVCSAGATRGQAKALGARGASGGAVRAACGLERHPGPHHWQRGVLEPIHETNRVFPPHCVVW